MKIIKMIKGHTLVNGKRYGLNSGCFEVEDDIAARFVKRGVAVYENKKAPASLANAALDEDDFTEEKSLEEMSLKELKALAKEKGVEVAGNKREYFINALSENANGNSDDDIYNDMSGAELEEIASELGINIEGLSREEIIAKCKEKEVE